jgi:diadenosine tetraphosphate (Ap4A) HIT family hydrolase
MNKKSVRSSSIQPASRSCELCRRVGGTLLWQDATCRVVLVKDRDYAGYCRVIWNSHVKEMTDLSSAQRAHCMRVVFAVERALRSVLAPDKINLASFGNMAPHLHWHVIPRFETDAHFPNPVWGKRQRSGRAGAAPRATAGLRASIVRQLEKLL